MPVKDIRQVVADNLRHWMDAADPPWTQEALAEKAQVAQKTVSNYLNPEQRAPGASGKQGSPKLYELDLIAQALGVEVWQLTREMTEHQRAAYEAIETAYKQLLDGMPRGEQMTSEEQRAVDKLRQEMSSPPRALRKRGA